ncbi:hypothetical protein Acr_05g0016730 [Actinidia rufa]|uniref:Uncharacterized protein n=1 Tax=Actinidia rufa TaxID=165716 RepID=A0A7J0ENH7_9ERIC|nr:hypothetical protein Acr_05g0016730 [Actinidia rufa]
MVAYFSLSVNTRLITRCRKHRSLTRHKQCWSKEQADKEATLKTEVIQKKGFIQKLLDNKAKELDEKTLECKRLNEMNKALAKELAEVTLPSDLNLVKEKILKLDSLGNEANNKGNRDHLADLLDLRNK